LRNLFDFLFDMSGRRTISGKPLAGGIGINPAVLTRRVFQNFTTAFTLVYNDMTVASIETTTLLGHEGTFGSIFDGLTNHRNYTPFYR
jgi:hypothetical protein